MPRASAAAPAAKAAEQPPAPPVAGAEAYERSDWLDGLPPAFDDLRERHVSAVREFERCVETCHELAAETENTRRAWRRAVRDAISAGDQPPERLFDSDVQRASLEVGEEDVVAARDAVSEVVVIALAELKSRRSELKGVVLGEALSHSLWAGVEGSMEAIKEQMREQLASLDDGIGGEIVDLTHPGPLTTPEKGEVLHAP